ncbi:unnamed protein product [Orchesella dallaii]|uniref:WAP domain-containing protein n=1 Tax=Orchesella dallaii TaxID=48710 RepID=A0ABP1R5H1_9HEXA
MKQAVVCYVLIIVLVSGSQARRPWSKFRQQGGSTSTSSTTTSTTTTSTTPQSWTCDAPITRTKPGTCPPTTLEICINCIPDVCSSDEDCNGRNICCGKSTCGNRCVAPDRAWVQ